ncbi:hypothetical protein [sulfur-oxidizing endosymbiont of Gigantopelta aegis]|uniref:IS66 family transposase n=1 Tax=sulfur-oxidizing endosymbiont of Gigantopelta aegis TaxID=2794934 RepID=UPI0018DC5233|nr:hypothetical protein [sulfur-oxidizing endosymbiont of Gigantopelta aegis]
MLSVIEQKNHRIKILEEALCLARSKRFAPSSEKSDGQERLFDEAEQAADDEGLLNLKPLRLRRKKNRQEAFLKDYSKSPCLHRSDR